MRTSSDKGRWGLSIPIKVVVLTGLAYLVVWGVGLAAQRSGVLDPSWRLGGVELSSVLFVLEITLVALAATAGTHFFLDRPLTRLTHAMGRAEEGDFLVRAPVVSNDELGELARAFNRMLSRITDLAANKIQADHDLIMVEEQVKFRERLEEKNAVIERTNRMLEGFVRDLSLIYEIGQEVNSIVDLEQLYATITETLRKYLRIHECALLVFDDEREELQVKASFGFPGGDGATGVSFRKGEGITGLVAETGKRIYIKDTSRDDRFLPSGRERPAEASSFLSVPLASKSEVLGVINFARHGVGSFSYQDVKMMSLVAGQVGLAIANARLYTRTRELSVRDELTGINNRRYFQQMFKMEWKRAVRFRRHLSLIMLDVDRFKDYNDSFGHLQGDGVLRQIGVCLKKHLREVDTVARFGGEEFVLLLPDTDKRGATVAAEKIRHVVEQQAFLTGESRPTRRITVSAGVATFPEDVGEMDDLIDSADIALYRAKEKGRNRVECFKPEASQAPTPLFSPDLLEGKGRRVAEKKKSETVQ